MEVLTLAFLAWLALNAFLTLIRLPFSDEKTSRLISLIVAALTGWAVWNLYLNMGGMPQIGAKLSRDDLWSTAAAVLRVWGTTLFWAIYIGLTTFCALMHFLACWMSWVERDAYVPSPRVRIREARA